MCTMENVLHFILFCVLQKCCAQPESNIILKGEGSNFASCRSDICRSTVPIKYRNVKCPGGKRVISYNDVMRPHKTLLESSAIKTPFWVNATANYTTWVIYRGTYTIDSANIASSTSVNNLTQFTDCITYCNEDSVPYIGLQKDKCFCLTSNALLNKMPIPYLEQTVVVCNEGRILYCSTRNPNNTAMTVYEKDTNIYTGFGECLKCYIKSSSYESCLPSSCYESGNVDILCKDSKGIFQGGNSADRLRYCEGHSLIYVDFKTLNMTSINNINKRYYWLNNFRESLFSMPGQFYQDRCVTGTNVGGKIKLQITNCTTAEYALCIKDDNVHESTANHTTITMKSTITVSTEFDVTTTSATRNIHVEDFSTLIIIVAVVSVFLLVLIATVLVKRFRKTRKSISEQGAVYAAVRRGIIHDANAIDHAVQPNVVQAIIENDNTYDHTNFTTRPSLHETRASNYDTVENIQLTGESIYHHTFTFKTSTDVIQGDESVYQHTTNV